MSIIPCVRHERGLRCECLCYQLLRLMRPGGDANMSTPCARQKGMVSVSKTGRFTSRQHRSVQLTLTVVTMISQSHPAVLLLVSLLRA